MVRGIAREEAERIIVQGFFEPVLQRIPLENLRIRLRRSIVRRMSKGHESETDTLDRCPGTLGGRRRRRVRRLAE